MPHLKIKRVSMRTKIAGFSKVRMRSSGTIGPTFSLAVRSRLEGREAVPRVRWGFGIRCPSHSCVSCLVYPSQPWPCDLPQALYLPHHEIRASPRPGWCEKPAGELSFVRQRGPKSLCGMKTRLPEWEHRGVQPGPWVCRLIPVDKKDFGT